jgi:hypothetical protein
MIIIIVIIIINENDNDDDDNNVWRGEGKNNNHIVWSVLSFLSHSFEFLKKSSKSNNLYCFFQKLKVRLKKLKTIMHNIVKLCA